MASADANSASENHTDDDAAFWNEIWDGSDPECAVPDAILASETADMPPGSALDLGCGDGGNAVWLAKQGWRVTTLDFSRSAIRAGKRLAERERVDVEFITADAAAHKPQTRYDLIISFYIQLQPAQRATMLSNAARALKPGGRLLIVAHDRSTPPSGWSKRDLLTLVNPDEIASELDGLLRIERALVIENESGAHAAHSHAHDCAHAAIPMSDESAHAAHSHTASMSSALVRATRPT